MKKILFWSAVTLFAAVSCNKVENDAPVQESNVPSFVASVDGADTKTVIDGMKSYWNGTEGIRVLDGALANGKVYTATVEKSQTATFNEVDGLVLNETADYLAVYPEGPAGSVTWDGDVASSAKKFWLPGDQTATEGSYDPSTHIAVACTEAGNTNLNFKNVVSLVKFTLQSDNVSEVCFYGNNSDVITGNFDVNYNGGEPTWTNDGAGYAKNAYAKITGNLEKGKTYYITVLPCEFEGGFSVETIDKTYGFKSTKKNSTTYDLKRGEILDLKDIDWTGKIYLNAGGDKLWDQANAWFTAYFMNDNKSTTEWVTLTKNSEGLYEGEIPTGTWKYVIFVRNNPAGTEPSWGGNVWNQTDDLELQKGNNVYTITGWERGDGNWSN